MSRLGTIWIEGREYDLDRLKLKEMKEVQHICQRPKMTDDGEMVLLNGTPYMEPTPYAELEFFDADVQIALAFIIIRRERPDFTLEDAGELEISGFGQPEEEVPDVGPPVEGVATNGQSSSSHDLSGVPEFDTPAPG